MTKGAHLFARCWLLVEGKTDFLFFSHIATMLDVSFDKNNVSIIEISSGGWADPFISAAGALGIEWVVFVDKDVGGNNLLKTAVDYLNEN
jgi:putative ATP-dependent endonuclease of OLD family